MEIDYEELRKHIEVLPVSIAYDLQDELTKYFDKCGLYYRAFCRCKGSRSAISKIKGKQYPKDGKLMQDLIGVRIALYFKDDVDICVRILQEHCDVLEIVRDEERNNNFSPIRLNLVCRMPDRIASQFEQEIWKFPIDKTFEIQVRTIFSEGWHEVEHDFRYKNMSDWLDHDDLSRNLNGIFATLETCDWAIIKVFDTLAYQKYKNNEWSSMLRNHLRIRFDDGELSPQIVDLFNKDRELAKEFFRIDRTRLLLCTSHRDMPRLPKKMDNIVFLINELMIHNEYLSAIVPQALRSILQPIITTFCMDS